MSDTLRKLRYRVCEINYLTQEGHLASSLSCLDLLDQLISRTLGDKVDSKYTGDESSRFILSKGHAALGFYATLEKYGWLSSEELENLGTQNSPLGGHPDSTKLDLAYISTGSLGHGLPIGVGAALSLTNSKKSKEVYVLCGDGEFMEGSVWESVIIATKLKLNNLVVIIDFNFTHVDTQLSADQLEGVFRSLGWRANVIDGHSEKEIQDSLNNLSSNSPTLIIAKTTLGHNIDFLQGKKEWHRKNLTSEILTQIKSEMNI
jgi:transketolase